MGYNNALCCFAVDIEEYNTGGGAEEAGYDSDQAGFRKHPLADCAPPPEMVQSLGLPTGHPVHLGTVLARCPHYATSMRSKVFYLIGIRNYAGRMEQYLLVG